MVGERRGGLGGMENLRNLMELEHCSRQPSFENPSDSVVIRFSIPLTVGILPMPSAYPTTPDWIIFNACSIVQAHSLGPLLSYIHSKQPSMLA